MKTQKGSPADNAIQAGKRNAIRNKEMYGLEDYQYIISTTPLDGELHKLELSRAKQRCEKIKILGIEGE